MAQNVRVHCRIRPQNDRETRSGGRRFTTVTGNKLGFLEAGEFVGLCENHFIFDAVHDVESSQRQVYDAVGAPVVRQVLSGYNATIFAYGQTGSGKTHTMSGSGRDEGIIPRVVGELFESEEMRGGRCALSVSVLEIYCENVHDLLAEAHASRPLKLTEHTAGQVEVEGCVEHSPRSAAEALELIRQAESVRATASTAMNADSSRSHSVVTIKIITRDATEDGEAVISRRATLRLVDLAGSESVKKTKSSGATLDEAKKINVSLSALGNVINALTTHKSHVPYRDSKLTRLLQSSLGGNGYTVLLVACSASTSNAEESLSTLRFGTRAKKVQQTAVVNADIISGGGGVEALRKLRELTGELEAARGRIAVLEAGIEKASKAKEKTARESETRRGNDAAEIKRARELIAILETEVETGARESDRVALQIESLREQQDYGEKAALQMRTRQDNDAAELNRARALVSSLEAGGEKMRTRQDNDAAELSRSRELVSSLEAEREKARTRQENDAAELSRARVLISSLEAEGEKVRTRQDDDAAALSRARGLISSLEAEGRSERDRAALLISSLEVEGAADREKAALLISKMETAVRVESERTRRDDDSAKELLIIISRDKAEIEVLKRQSAESADLSAVKHGALQAELARLVEVHRESVAGHATSLQAAHRVQSRHVAERAKVEDDLATVVATLSAARSDNEAASTQLATVRAQLDRLETERSQRESDYDSLSEALRESETELEKALAERHEAAKERRQAEHDEAIKRGEQQRAQDTQLRAEALREGELLEREARFASERAQGDNRDRSLLRTKEALASLRAEQLEAARELLDLKREAALREEEALAALRKELEARFVGDRAQDNREAALREEEALASLRIELEEAQAQLGLLKNNASCEGAALRQEEALASLLREELIEARYAQDHLKREACEEAALRQEQALASLREELLEAQAQLGLKQEAALRREEALASLREELEARAQQQDLKNASCEEAALREGELQRSKEEELSLASSSSSSLRLSELEAARAQEDRERASSDEEAAVENERNALREEHAAALEEALLLTGVKSAAASCDDDEKKRREVEERLRVLSESHEEARTEAERRSALALATKDDEYEAEMAALRAAHDDTAIMMTEAQRQALEESAGALKQQHAELHSKLELLLQAHSNIESTLMTERATHAKALEGLLHEKTHASRERERAEAAERRFDEKQSNDVREQLQASLDSEKESVARAEQRCEEALGALRDHAAALALSDERHETERRALRDEHAAALAAVESARSADLDRQRVELRRQAEEHAAEIAQVTAEAAARAKAHAEQLEDLSNSAQTQSISDRERVSATLADTNRRSELRQAEAMAEEQGLVAQLVGTKVALADSQIELEGLRQKLKLATRPRTPPPLFLPPRTGFGAIFGGQR